MTTDRRRATSVELVVSVANTALLSVLLLAALVFLAVCSGVGPYGG